MKNGFEGEKIIIISLISIIIITISFSVFTVFNSNNSLRNNTVNMKSNGENITPSDTNSTTARTTTTNNNNNNNNNITEDDIDKMNIDTKNEVKVEPEQIATYTTTIYDDDKNRVENISLTNSKLNGTVIKAGEEFSFNNTIGPMDESKGFKKALGFDSDGNKIQISGGGICQISSTLYNCALIANLEIIERHPHSHRVYYVPQDKDATIFYGSLDLKFKNNTDRDIKIEASNDSANVTINLYKI